MRSKSSSSSRQIEPRTSAIVMTLCVFWLMNAVLAGGVFHLKLFYIYFGWTALFLILPQVAFGVAAMLVFVGWCHWLATGKELPASALFLLPASLVVWAIPFGIALRETTKVVVSCLVPYGRYGAELDGWTELKMWLVPTFWFFVPFALLIWLCRKVRLVEGLRFRRKSVSLTL